MDPRDRYFWDLTGYLVLRQVLSPSQVKAANDAYEFYARKVLEMDEEARDRPGRPAIRDGVVVRTSNQEPHFLEMEKPYCDAFRDMLAHPLIVSYLREMCGRGFRLDHGPEIISHIKGMDGGGMHGSGDPHKPWVGYHHDGENHWVGGVTVSWQLADQSPGAGGFSCVPGSHKSKYRMPKGVVWREDDLGAVYQPICKAGDVVFFMDGAQTHGTMPWKADHQRRSVLIKYTGRTCARQGPAMFLGGPEDYWETEVVDGMTSEQRAVMFGPYSNYREELHHLLVTSDGSVEIEPRAPRRRTRPQVQAAAG